MGEWHGVPACLGEAGPDLDTLFTYGDRGTVEGDERGEEVLCYVVWIWRYIYARYGDMLNLEKEDGILKREKRKQSNRESARRSRMRKQAETEELAASADTLSAQNRTLKSEITVIKENSKKLKMENITLMDALKKTQLIQAGETSSEKFTPQTPPTDSTKNFLSKLSEPVSFSSGRQETDSSDKSRGKRHQQLVASSRADAVAAS